MPRVRYTASKRRRNKAHWLHRWLLPALGASLRRRGGEGRSESLPDHSARRVAEAPRFGDDRCAQVRFCAKDEPGGQTLSHGPLVLQNAITGNNVAQIKQLITNDYL